MLLLKKRRKITTLEEAINALFEVFQTAYPQVHCNDIKRLKSKLRLNSLFMPSHIKDIGEITKNGLTIESSKLDSLQKKLFAIDEFF